MENQTPEIIKKDVFSESPAELIKLAITGGADLDKLEKLLTIQQKWEEIKAKKAYHEAMATFKANPPKIDKNKSVAYGNTKYNHASLANVTEKINEALSKCGLSASWSTKQNGAILVTCKITHIKGHSEETTLAAPSDMTGSKNAIQAIGSTITYLERYTLLALTGLATYDQDDDGRSAGAPIEYIDEKQVSQILDYINDIGAKLPKFLQYMKITKLEEMTKADFPKALAALQSAQKKKETKK